jgi:hypothetical protein
MADPRVEHLPDGGWRMPQGMMPPELTHQRMPFNHIGLLVGDRPYAQLAGEIENAFRGIGIRLTVTP